jgi:hypothetical protein
MRHLLLFSMVGLAACNDHIGSQDFAQSFAQAFCAAQISCGLTDTADRATCERLMTDRPPPSLALAPGQLASGTVHFDEDAARQCVDGLTPYACHTGSYALPDACSRVFTITTAVGAPCSSDRSCANDQVCQFSGSCGTCQPAPGVGASCGSVCAGHARCVVAPDGSSATCVQRLAAGQECTSGDNQTCDDGLACIAGADGGTCQPPATAGESCAPYLTESDFNGGLFAPTGACQPGLVCDFTRTQPVCIPPGKVGEPCGSMDACDAGLYCSVLGPGISIQNHVVSLVPNQGVCVTPQAIGAACDSTHFCQTFEACVGGLCVRAPVAGNPCTLDGPHCVDGFCEANVCVGASQVGDACDPSTDHCGLFLSCDPSTSRCVSDAQRCQ